MRRLVVHLVWLAVGLGACAVGTESDSTTPPATDAGAKDSAAPFGKDASAPSAKDASAPAVDSGTTQTSNCTAFTGALATFDFSGEPGNQTATPATSIASGVTAGDLARSSSLTATSGTSSINASNWTTSQNLDSTRYYTFTLTPDSGCTLDVSTLAITTTASKTGPANAALATSDDGFSSTVAFTVGASDTPSVGVSGATNAVEVRIYGFGASSTAGTLRINSTLTVSGSVQ